MLAVFVLDSVSLSVLGELEAAGRLPVLSDLRRRGRWHAVVPSVPPIDTGHFTLYTGRPLADHGLHYLFQWVSAEQRLAYLHTLPTPPAFWERPEAHSLVIDPYECWEPRGGGGVFLRGFQFRERFVLPPHARPAAEWWRLTRRLGRPPRIDDLYGSTSVERLVRLRRALRAGPARAVGAVVESLAGREFDLLFVGFGSLHLGGHHFWDLSQLPSSERASAREAGLETALPDLHAAADEALGRILELLPDHTDVLVLSPSGMGPNTSRSDLLPGMVRRVLGQGESAAGDAGDLVWRVRGSVPTGLREAAVRPLPAQLVRRLTASLYLRGVDWSRTRAFVLPGDYRGFVRVNLKGRERDGIVEPADLEGLLEELTAGLATFCDPDGAPCIESIDRREALVGDGLATDLLPDLVVRWSTRPATELTSVSSPRFGAVKRFGVGSGRSGNHTDDAWILAVPGRSRLLEPSRPAQLVDVAATAGFTLGPGESLFEHP